MRCVNVWLWRVAVTCVGVRPAPPGAPGRRRGTPAPRPLFFWVNFNYPKVARIGLGRHHERTGRPSCAEIISCVLSGGLKRRLCRANASDEPGAHTAAPDPMPIELDRPDLAELFRS